MRKGVELPISAMLILVMGIMIVVGVAAMFLGVWKPAAGGVSLQTATSEACRMMHEMQRCGKGSSGVPVYAFDVHKVGDFPWYHECIKFTREKNTIDEVTNAECNLYWLCRNWYGCGTLVERDPAFVQCCDKNVCGCPS